MFLTRTISHHLGRARVMAPRIHINSAAATRTSGRCMSSRCCSTTSSDGDGSRLEKSRFSCTPLTRTPTRTRTASIHHHCMTDIKHVSKRSFSSSSSSSSKSDGDYKVDKQQLQDEPSLDTPSLSDLSPEDLNLAIQAASEVDGHQQQHQQQQKNEDIDLSSALNIDNIPGTSKGGSRKLAIIYTCKVCNTRSAKKFTERAYKHGVVLVRCPNCESLHLISDQLGYFSDKNENGRGWDIETFMKEIGNEDNIKVATEGQEVLEVTLEDVLGDKINEVGATDANESAGPTESGTKKKV